MDYKKYSEDLEDVIFETCKNIQSESKFTISQGFLFSSIAIILIATNYIWYGGASEFLSYMTWGFLIASGVFILISTRLLSISKSLLGSITIVLLKKSRTIQRDFMEGQIEIIEKKTKRGRGRPRKVRK